MFKIGYALKKMGTEKLCSKYIMLFKEIGIEKMFKYVMFFKKMGIEKMFSK